MEYELTVLLKPSLTREYWEDTTGCYLRKLCSIGTVEDDGEKTIAYSIDGYNRARCLFYTIKKPVMNTLVKELDRDKLVLRYLMVTKRKQIRKNY